MPEYLTIKQLSNRLGRSRFTLYRDIKAGRIPAHRLCPKGMIYLDPAEVRASLAAESSSPQLSLGAAA